MFLPRLLVAALALPACLSDAVWVEQDVDVAADTAPIIGGTVTHAYPAVGQLLVGAHRQATETGSCTATLIGCRRVLTAAHCICPTDHYTPECDTQPRVMYFPNAGFFDVTRIAAHPGYETSGLAYRVHDVAIVTLSEPATGIAPVAIANVGPVHGPAYAVGFGRSSRNLVDQGIKRAGPIEISECEGPESDDEHICFAGPAQTCHGDSGGPIFVGDGASMRTTGVTSYAPAGCGNGSVAMNVVASAPFIAAEAGDDLDATCPTAELTVVGEVGSLDSAGDIVSWQVEVPPGSRELRVAMNGQLKYGPLLQPTATNFDLYVQRGDRAPTPTDADCVSAEPISVGYCAFPDPLPGTYQILVEAVVGGGDVQVTTTIVGAEGRDDKGDQLDFAEDGGCSTGGRLSANRWWLVFSVLLVARRRRTR